MVYRLICAGMLLLWASACNAAPAGAPADFAITYDWREGSLPPPYHYSYRITLNADGAATYALTPDYAGADVPTWVESFTVSAAARDALYADLRAAGLWREGWREEPEPPVGGSSASLQATANGRTVQVPSFVVAAQQARAAQMYTLIEAQVPAALRAQLEAQREAYVAERE